MEKYVSIRNSGMSSELFRMPLEAYNINNKNYSTQPFFVTYCMSQPAFAGKAQPMSDLAIAIPDIRIAKF